MNWFNKTPKPIIKLMEAYFDAWELKWVYPYDEKTKEYTTKAKEQYKKNPTMVILDMSDNLLKKFKNNLYGISGQTCIHQH